MNLDKALVELVRKIAALGVPAIVLVIVMATTGLTGAAAITAALAFLGGPAGMLGGILALGIMGLIADKLAQYGLDFLLMMIYQEKVKNQPESAEEEIVKEIDNLPVISNELKSKLKGVVRKRFTFMLVGRTGVGKSSTINRLLGEELAKVGAYEATTMDVEKYQTVINGVKFDVLDTPGLCDDEEEIGNDFNYLERIKKYTSQVDSMWFVTRLDETRVSSDEKRGIRLISEALGEKIWANSVIIFTFANSVDPSRFQEALQRRTELIHKEISKHTSPNIAQQIPSLPVENTSKTTSDGKDWLGELFTLVLERASDAGSIPFAAGMKDSFGSESSNGNTNDEPRINLDDEQKERVKKKLDASLVGMFAAGGAILGSLFGPGGTIVGGLLGSAIGLRMQLDD